MEYLGFLTHCRTPLANETHVLYLTATPALHMPGICRGQMPLLHKTAAKNHHQAGLMKKGSFPQAPPTLPFLNPPPLTAFLRTLTVNMMHQLRLRREGGPGRDLERDGHSLAGASTHDQPSSQCILTWSRRQDFNCLLKTLIHDYQLQTQDWSQKCLEWLQRRTRDSYQASK